MVDVSTVVTYEMTSRLVSDLYPNGMSHPKTRTLKVLRDYRERPAETDAEAVEAILEYMRLPFVDAEPEVLQVTRVTTTVEYEDASGLVGGN